MSRKSAGKIVFVVPYFLNGDIRQLRVYTDVAKAQAALKRYVEYPKLLQEAKRANPKATRTRAHLDAYGAIERGPYAGTSVYEIEVDERKPVRRPPRGG
jgi:hypothetical protein